MFVRRNLLYGKRKYLCGLYYSVYLFDLRGF